MPAHTHQYQNESVGDEFSHALVHFIACNLAADKEIEWEKSMEKRQEKSKEDGRLRRELKCLRLPKADAFTPAIIFNEFNSSGFECSTNSSFIGQCNGDLSVNDLGATNCCYTNLRGQR